MAGLSQPQQARATAQETRQDPTRDQGVGEGPEAQGEAAAETTALSLEDRQQIAGAVEEAYPRRGSAEVRIAEAYINVRTLQRWKAWWP